MDVSFDFTLPNFGRHVTISSAITGALTEAGFEVLTAVATKCTVFWLLYYAFRREPNLSEEFIASNFRSRSNLSTKQIEARGRRGAFVKLHGVKTEKKVVFIVNNNFRTGIVQLVQRALYNRGIGVLFLADALLHNTHTDPKAHPAFSPVHIEDSFCGLVITVT
jgi:hypothetical protein